MDERRQVAGAVQSSRQITRRSAMGLGAAGVASALAGCGSPVAAGLLGVDPPPERLTYWNLFGGGDGASMKAMEKVYRRRNPQVDLSSTVLSWGTPYYTKLALATTGNAPPDVAVVHLSRLPTLARADLLQSLDPQEMSAAGMPRDKFEATALKRSSDGGKLFAIPLDTHPFVMFYNVEVCRKAGLLDRSGKLRPIRGPKEFRKALEAAAKVTGRYGGVVNITNDPSTNWRWFATLYYQLGGEVVSDGGTQIVLDDDKAAKALSYMQSLTTSGLMPRGVDQGGVASLFSTGKVGFLLDGEWQIPTYRGTKVKFSVEPVPHIFGPKTAAYADSHALVLPRNDAMDADRRATAMGFVRSLLGSSSTWAEGGHLPAWLPVQRSRTFLAMEPQSNYVEAARTARYDPPAWYSGAGSQFQNIVGAAVASSQTGVSTPKSAIKQIRSRLAPLADAKPPIGEEAN